MPFAGFFRFTSFPGNRPRNQPPREKRPHAAEPCPSSAPPAARAEGIESANVVGYQNIALEAEKQIIAGVGFETVGGGSVDIQSIKMDSATPADSGTMMWFWDKDSGTYTYAYWVELNFETGKYGWGDFDNWAPITKTFAPGEGFWIKAPAAATVTVAGQLVTTDATTQYVGVNLEAEKQCHVTNPMPVGSTDIQTIKMSDGVAADSGTMIWYWDKDSGTYTYAYWVELNFETGNYGWGDFDNWAPITKVFTAGEGFWVKAPAACQIKFLNPFYTK